jgi:hypothetical protein
MQTQQGIHCKVSCNNQFRRFQLDVGTEFSSLQSQIRKVLGLDGEFVLKYKDIEGDLITISSNEEYQCALAYSNGNLLRMSVTDAKGLPAPVGEDVEIVKNDQSGHGHCRRGHGGNPSHGCAFGAGNGHGRGHGIGGNCHWKEGNSFSPCLWKEKLTAKRNRIIEALAEIEKGTEQKFKKEKLQKKLEKIDARLQKLNSGEIDMKEKRCH